MKKTTIEEMYKEDKATLAEAVIKGEETLQNIDQKY